MRCKKTIDARAYSHEMLEQMCRDAVKRVEAGESPEAVASGWALTGAPLAISNDFLARNESQPAE